MAGLLWQAVVSCVSSAISIIVGALIYQVQVGYLRKQHLVHSFNLPGICTVVYINCTSPTITLSVGAKVGEVRIWEKISSTYFCIIPSPIRLPCWWSEDERLSGFVRIGPLHPMAESVTTLTLALIALGAFFIVASLLHLCLVATFDSRRLRWARNENHRRQHRQEDQGGTQLDGLPLVLEETILNELYPMSDENWAEKAIAHSRYAQGRIEILRRFFEARRRRLQRREETSHPYGSSAESDSELDYDDDDLPVDECYICLSRFRRRMIWWPCGHWLCATCARKVLRKSLHRGCASCPNCRALFLPEELVILHLLPRVVTPAAEGPPTAVGNENENGNRIFSVEMEAATSAVVI
ncbi:uncharacterized protein Tco025E_01905 [Trypanosoma conorhini]|uniref:RING-type domain-containing protein n=1 Tax=Trypanosoma conorhini TaxID=83891 RepID=A0A3R7N5W1_9TRYP|nr:uncharacterized protein Tco025E_01905 [Trypanosoma conorhini]RNF25901.1 hypothetical protein Tco025E_01905 [Trypanosoma conorhini]